MNKPNIDGFALSPEWAAHERCWMTWPGTDSKALCEPIAELAKAISSFEPVSMIVAPEHVAEISLSTNPGITHLPFDHDNPWIKNYGPSFIDNAKGEIAGIAWSPSEEGKAGKKNPAKAILKQLRMRHYRAKAAFDGGVIDTDGEGTILISQAALFASHLFASQGNIEDEKMAIEELLIEYIGARAVIWLPGALQDDLWPSSVANLARFLRPGLVVALAAIDPTDPNFKSSQDNLSILRSSRDSNGNPLQVVEIEQPRPQFDSEGRRFAFSYTNFYRPNGGLILPAFDDSGQDRKAFDAFSRLLPESAIVQLPATELAQGGGGIWTACLPQPQGPIVSS